MIFNLTEGKTITESHFIEELPPNILYMKLWVENNIELIFGITHSGSFFSSHIKFESIDHWNGWLQFLHFQSNSDKSDPENVFFNYKEFCSPIEFVQSTDEVVLIIWDITTNITLDFKSLELFASFCKFLIDNYSNIELEKD